MKFKVGDKIKRIPGTETRSGNFFLNLCNRHGVPIGAVLTVTQDEGHGSIRVEGLSAGLTAEYFVHAIPEPIDINKFM